MVAYVGLVDLEFHINKRGGKIRGEYREDQQPYDEAFEHEKL